MARLEVFALLAAAISPALGLAQEPLFRADTTLLELEVRVSDKRGRTIDSLTREDFAVFESGRPRPIVGFEYVDASRGAERAFAPSRISRLLILLDAPPEEASRAIPFVRRFLRERMPEGMLVSLNGLAFTDDKATLLDQLERGAWTRDALGTAATSAIDPALRETGVGEVEDYKANLLEDQFGRAKLYRYLELVGALARYPGRKSVALFSPGYPLGFDYGSETFVNAQDLDLLDILRGEATRGRVRFYAVDIRGLSALGSDSDASASSLAPEVQGAFAGDRGGSLGASDSFLLLQNGLAVLARQTGGEAVLNENSLGKVFDPVLRDEGGYYLISYAVPEAQAGARRDLEVRVQREGVRLDYQRRYYDRESFEAALRQGRGIPIGKERSTAAGEEDSDPALTAFRMYQAALEALQGGESEITGAIETLERATATDPRLALAWTLLGNLHAASERPEEARDAFERAIAVDPLSSGPYWGLIQMASLASDWAQVRAEAARLLESIADDAGGLYAAALAEWNLENTDAARQAAERAAEAGAGDEFPRVHKVLGLARAAQGDWGGAAAAYEAYLGLAPRAPDAQEVEAKLAEWASAERLERLRDLADEGRWREAAERSAQLLADGERETEAHFFHALAQFNLGRTDLAEEHADLASAAGNAADLPEIRYLLGALAAQRGDLRKGAAEYRAYLEAKPDSDMAEEIRARIAEWEALERAEPHGPVSTLDELRTKVKRTLDAVPNYACAVVMERGEMSPKTGRDYARARARAERDGKPAPPAVFDRSDRVRLDVAMISGRELFSWPGESEFSEKPLAEMIGFGTASTGDYALHARNLFVEQNTEFRPAGQDAMNERTVARYDFAVPLEQSRFAVQQDGAPAVVAYDGSIWAAGSELAAADLVVKEFPADYAIEWSRTRIEYQNVALGRERFLLPRISDVVIRFRSGAQNSLRVAFRDCRSYRSQSAITFGEELQPQEAQDDEPVELQAPAGLELRVRIESPIRSREAMVGDPVKGVLERPLMAGLETLFPAGARVEGRIRRLDSLSEPGEHIVLGIEWTRVESEGTFWKAAAEMDGVAGARGDAGMASTVEEMRRWRNMGDGAAWKSFFKRWDDGQRSSGPTVYYERSLARVGLLFFHGPEFELQPGLTTRWVTVAPR